ncbi:hypothetical protein HanRHA438_Chr01g0016081 [Helianthus annuus]|nr:hypothetical protein HanRHA438_Chr01g0016081 [Helianthus annuus]
MNISTTIVPLKLTLGTNCNYPLLFVYYLLCSFILTGLFRLITKLQQQKKRKRKRKRVKRIERKKIYLCFCWIQSDQTRFDPQRV